MRVVVAAVFAGFVVAACQTPCPAPETGPVTRRLVCEDGSNLTVTFTRNPDLARIEEEGYTTVTLQARISGAGYNYTDGNAELRQRGGETAWTRPGATQTMCHEEAANGADHELPRQAVSMAPPAPECPRASLATLRPLSGASAS